MRCIGGVDLETSEDCTAAGATCVDGLSGPAQAICVRDTPPCTDREYRVCEGPLAYVCDNSDREVVIDCRSTMEGGFCMIEGNDPVCDSTSCPTNTPATCETDAVRACVLGRSVLTDCAVLGLGSCAVTAEGATCSG